MKFGFSIPCLGGESPTESLEFCYACVVYGKDRYRWWLQVLPAGASKGSGVSRLLHELNVEPQHLMALGDGENDVEMLQVERQPPAC